MDLNPTETLLAEPPITKAVAARRPFLTIRAAKGLVALDLGELWQFRDLMFALALRDIKLRYKQTALGVIWVVLQPLMAAGILTFVFGSVAHMDSGPIPLFAFLYAGNTFWNLFNSVLSKAGASLTGNTNLISKVFFPRLILPLSALPSSFLDFGIALIMLAAVMVMYHVVPSFGLLLLPLWICLLLFYSIGIGLVVTSLMVSYRDVAYMMPLALQILYYACPIIYPASKVPVKALAYYNLNPLSAVFESITWSVFSSGSLNWFRISCSAAVGIVVLLSGVVAFKNMERKFADVI
jgi:lipopolysaccharide transport system permease protein